MKFVVNWGLKFLAAILLMGLCQCLLCAQDNPYGIDDECYELFRQTEQKIGHDSFNSSYRELLTLSDRRSDLKAKTLSHVLGLRDAIARNDDGGVDSALSGLLSTAEAANLSQYYFYGYILSAAYYNNIGYTTKSLALAQEMEAVSKEMNDVYGRWSSDKYLASLYIARHNSWAAREYLLEAIDIYNSTEEPSVRSQSLSSVYADLASTYEFGNDSLKIYMSKAYQNAVHPVDTLRYRVMMAQVAAYDGDITTYRMNRDMSRENPSLSSVMPNASLLYECLDLALSGDMDSAYDRSAPLDFNACKLLLAICRKYQDYFNADRFSERISNTFMEINYSEYAERLAEIGASIGNDRLNRQLLEKSQQLNRLLTMMFICLFAFALIVSVFAWFYTNNLSRERDMAEVANRMKTNFVQNMRHEIRTPLNAVVGFSQLLSMPGDYLTEEERNQYAKYVVSNSDILTMLIDDILSLSDVDNGSFQVSMGQCNCNDICRTAIASVQTMVPSGVECSMTSDVPDNLVLMSDERRIQQVLVNYLTNACKYTTSGSIVLDCSLSENPGKVTFSVTDTGVGIPAGAADEIFSRFAKLDQYKQGSGLGLSICRVIAQKLGGEVLLDKNYGRCAGLSETGSRFLFILPR